MQESFYVKFHSIWDRIPPRGFLNDIKRKLQLDFGDFKDVKTIFVERKDNQHYHLRASVTHKRIMMKLKKAGRLNEDGETYSLRLGNYAVLFQTEKQTNEQFEVVRLKEADRDKVVMVKLIENQQLLDMMNKLDEYNLKRWEYISITRKCAFIGFMSVEDRILAIKKFKRDSFMIQPSATGLKIKKPLVSQLGAEMKAKKTVNKEKAEKKSKKKNKTENKEKKKTQEQNQIMPFRQGMTQNQMQQPSNMQQTFPINQQQSMQQQQMIHYLMQQNMLQQQMLQMTPNTMLQSSFFPIFQNSNNNNNSNNRSLSLNDFNVVFYPKNNI